MLKRDFLFVQCSDISPLMNNDDTNPMVYLALAASKKIMSTTALGSEIICTMSS